MAKSLSTPAFLGRLTLVVLVISAVSIALTTAYGQLALATRQIYFIPPPADKPGIMILDVNRDLFAPFVWEMPVPPLGDWAWSPDGKQIAFVVRHFEGYDLRVMDADGGNQRSLIQDFNINREPSWSPDGERLAFVSDRDGLPEIYTINTDGGNLRRLTSHRTITALPAWSPDGRHIAYQAWVDGDYEIFVLDLRCDNCGQPTQLTFNDADDASPNWSPDGQHIAFGSNREGVGGRIYRMDADGGNQQALPDSGGSDYKPSWSPDGGQILFQSTLGSNNNRIYIMDADGLNLRRLTRLGQLLYSPLWDRRL
jgi:Tol biopolymer transport system component